MRGSDFGEKTKLNTWHVFKIVIGPPFQNFDFEMLFFNLAQCLRNFYFYPKMGFVFNNFGASARRNVFIDFLKG